MSTTTIQTELRENLLLVKIVERRIFLKVGEKFREEFIPLTERECKAMLVDCGNVEVMNSSGLGVLILARDILDKRGIPIYIYGLNQLMNDIFLRMRLDLLFTLCESETDALLRAGK